MKKLLIFLIAGFACLAGNSFAQSSDPTIKATSGFTTDVNFSPFDLPISLDLLNVRWFYKPGYALRLGFNADVTKSKSDNNQSGQQHLIQKQTTSTFGINPGIEKHFSGTNRLSPYIGAELSYTIHSAKSVVENETEESYRIEGSLVNFLDFPNRAYNAFGIGLLTGIDFYIARNLYLGAEFGYGLENKIYRKVEQIEDGNTTVLAGENKEINLSTNVRSSMKLGWKF